jgi:hypothetical protein
MAGALRAALRPAFAARQRPIARYPRKSNKDNPQARPGSVLVPMIALQIRAQVRRQLSEMLDIAR